MKNLFKFTLVFLYVLGNTVLSGQSANTKAYAEMQNCMAKAEDVIDNGSYERYCIAAYNYIVQIQERSTVNSSQN